MEQSSVIKRTFVLVYIKRTLLQLCILFQQRIEIIHMKCTKKNIPRIFNPKLPSKRYSTDQKEILWKCRMYLINREQFKIQQRIKEHLCDLHLELPIVFIQHFVLSKELWSFSYYLPNAWPTPMPLTIILDIRAYPLQLFFFSKLSYSMHLHQRATLWHITYVTCVIFNFQKIMFQNLFFHSEFTNV